MKKVFAVLALLLFVGVALAGSYTNYLGQVFTTGTTTEGAGYATPTATTPTRAQPEATVVWFQGVDTNVGYLALSGTQLVFVAVSYNGTNMVPRQTNAVAASAFTIP